jgi:DNA invertase Pin-like site-specific DNA recombinase
VAETFEYIKRVTGYGIQFVSFTEEHFRTTGPAGELMIAVAAWFAKQERLRLNGTRSGRPFGRPRVVFRRDEAVELRAQGRRWREIAKRFNVSVASIRRACGHLLRA